MITAPKQTFKLQGYDKTIFLNNEQNNTDHVELLRGFSPHFNSYFHYQNIISCSNILGFFVFFQEKSVYRCLFIYAIGFNVQDFLTLNNDFYFQQPFWFSYKFTVNYHVTTSHRLFLLPHESIRKVSSLNLESHTSDNGEVVTPFMQDGDYPTRNFATLGPFTIQPPFIIDAGQMSVT
ncbi:hypothetical protein POVWA1_062050 [Plasmodium ovale wallikeri]|uniref:Uncharacterized protein n=1 Tax=Plasmodium ovale wallikeri TaxID=864142 RepID=A0A1A9A3P1_PLAOA|nr:hypothetical protein POVWA1_062050 [Plasmodium ovale wallikeri]